MSEKRLKPEETVLDSLQKLATTIDQFEQYSRPHATQMAVLAEAIACRVGLTGLDLQALKIAALLHDIGELAIDSPAVRSAGRLDFRQRLEMQRHPIIGEQQVAKRGLGRQVQLLVRWHHEWWNGTGYPDMLWGENIPVGARILRLVDTYDSLRSWRPYRDAISEEEAERVIAASAGIEFDPALVEIMLTLFAQERSKRCVTIMVEEPKPHPEPEVLEAPTRRLSLNNQALSAPPPVEEDVIQALAEQPTMETMMMEQEDQLPDQLSADWQPYEESTLELPKMKAHEDDE